MFPTGLDRFVGPTKKSTLVPSPVRSETGILFMVVGSAAKELKSKARWSEARSATANWLRRFLLWA